MAYQSTHSLNPDEETLKKRTRKAMQSIERRKKAQEKDAFVLGMALDSFGNSTSEGRLSGVIWTGRLVSGRIALILCAYAFWNAL